MTGWPGSAAQFCFLRFDKQGYVNFQVLENAGDFSIAIDVQCLTSPLVGTISKNGNESLGDSNVRATFLPFELETFPPRSSSSVSESIQRVVQKEVARFKNLAIE